MSELNVQFNEMGEAPGVEFAELAGAIDASTVHIFQNQLEEARKRGVTKLIMDISKIKYVNSTGLGSLVKYADAFKAGGGGVVLLRVPAKVKIVIEMLGLHEFFEMCNSEKEAVAALGAGAAPAAPAARPPAAKPAAPPRPTPAPRPSSRRVEAAPSPRPAPPRPAAPRARPQHEPELVEPVPMEVTELVPHTAPAAEAPPRPAAARADFPMVVTCATCSIGVEVSESGNFKCPRCSTILYVDGQGNVNFFAPKSPMPIQMTLVSSPECTEGFLHFFTTVSAKRNVPEAQLNNAVDGLREVLHKIAQEAYLAKPSTYHLLLVVSPEELVVKTSDHGRMLNGADAGSTFPVAAKAFDEFEITTHPKGGNLVKMVKKLG